MAIPKCSRRAKVKSPYFLKDGVPVPGVTSVLKLRAKPPLVPWANKLGLAGIDSQKYTDEKAAIGTLAHSMSLKQFRSDLPDLDLSEYSKLEIDLAQNCALKFYEWQKAHVLEPILVEEKLVSEVHRYGGTPDFYGKVDGVLTLLDLKTGGLYPEAWIQLAAYGVLLEEQGHQIDQRILLNIGRDETENFVQAKRQGPSLPDEEAIFFALLTIYFAEKRLEGK